MKSRLPHMLLQSIRNRNSTRVRSLLIDHLLLLPGQVRVLFFARQDDTASNQIANVSFTNSSSGILFSDRSMITIFSFDSGVVSKTSTTVLLHIRERIVSVFRRHIQKIYWFDLTAEREQNY